MITMARQLYTELSDQLGSGNHEEATPKFKTTRSFKVVAACDRCKSVQQVNPSKFDKLTSENIDAAWIKFWNTRSPSLRSKIIEYYLPIATKVGNRHKKFLPYRPLVEGCDLIGDATVGLIHAVDKFDPYLGIKFETFCKMRMFGAIVDSLREMQHFPRSTSKLKREIRNLSAAYVEKFGREPTDVEFVNEYGIEYQSLLCDPLLRSNVYNQGLNQQGDNSGCNGCYEDFESKYLAVEGHTDALDQQMHANEIFEICNQYLPSEMHRDAILFYYSNPPMTLKEIGRALVTFSNAKPLCPSSVSKLIKISHVILRQVPGLKERLQSMDFKD